MSNPNLNRIARASGVVFALMIVVAGCGTDEETFSDRSKTTSKAETPPPVEVVATSSAPETVAVVPAPPVEATYQRSETAYLEGRYDEAVDLFTRYTERRPANPWGHYMLGLSAWKTGRYESAEAAFEQAIALDSTLVKARFNLGRVLIEASRPSEALAVIDRAIAIDGDSNTARRLQGRAFHTLGDPEKAAAAYRRAIAIDPEDAWSMNNLALVLMEGGRYPDALTALARAVELRTDVPVFFNNLGMALECTGHFRDAETAYATAVSLDAANAKAAANRDRVAGVVEQPGLVPADLATLARVFESEVESWQAVVSAQKE